MNNPGHRSVLLAASFATGCLFALAGGYAVTTMVQNEMRTADYPTPTVTLAEDQPDSYLVVSETPNPTVNANQTYTSIYPFAKPFSLDFPSDWELEVNTPKDEESEEITLRNDRAVLRILNGNIGGKGCHFSSESDLAVIITEDAIKVTNGTGEYYIVETERWGLQVCGPSKNKAIALSTLTVVGYITLELEDSIDSLKQDPQLMSEVETILSSIRQS
ncbi:MAG: hypothetical protein TR69_WS6001000860 [candidate division WS6 bacterium OLB20]|uniref:Uncharacterized protein n=1 Tax=candidate division WS6 bacterium OLB20 TaxID=1617426 RepID=A0A136LYV5_9BACT|nr:MAG: hypothetical protein TR69_WS6001000860 [candidate division WS6 bacterium OLB20]